MSIIESEYRVEDLSLKTWPDFEKFFSKYNGVQGGCWCVYYHRTGSTPGKTLEERANNNHEYKKMLMKDGKSRAILIYYGDEVVASCQYGTKSELPRIDYTRRYKNLQIESPQERMWRITCFFVDVPHRHKGLATMALKSALGRIAEEGGGIVEAYPVTHKKTVEVWFGSLKMFTDEGFEVVSEFGRSNVLVRKHLPGAK